MRDMRDEWEGHGASRRVTEGHGGSQSIPYPASRGLGCEVCGMGRLRTELYRLDDYSSLLIVRRVVLMAVVNINYVCSFEHIQSSFDL